jgi:hypothetical protein
MEETEEPEDGPHGRLAEEADGTSLINQGERVGEQGGEGEEGLEAVWGGEKQNRWERRQGGSRMSGEEKGWAGRLGG